MTVALKTSDRFTDNFREWARELGVMATRVVTQPGALGGRPATGPIQVIDLFCGAGGLSAGFEILGRLRSSFRLVAAVDRDPYSASTYASNLPIRPLIADLGTIAADKRRLDKILDELPPICPTEPLVLIGGPPCQGFSAHRKKDGPYKDDRNELIMSFAKIAIRLQPTFIVFENVPEVMSERHWHRYSQMKSVLEHCGYIVRAQIHNLAGFGVPQERFRTLVLASKKPFALPQPFLSPDQFRTVRAVIGRLPPLVPGVPSPDDPMHVSTRHRPETIATIRRVPVDGGRRPPGVGPRCLQSVDGFRDVYGRLFWDKPANTITAYARNPASGRYVHPQQHRGLSVREAALLQGFPPDFFFDGPFDHKFLQIGNAVPPMFSSYLAAHVLGELTTDIPPPDHHSDEHILSPTSNSFSSGIAGRKKGGRG